MPLNWSTTTDEATSNGVKCLVYGPAGNGKTILCASAPRPIFLSAEEGLLSLNHHNLVRRFGEERAEELRDRPVLKIRNGVDLRDAVAYVSDKKNHQHFDTICVDSVSEIADIMLIASKKSNKDGRMAYGEIGELVAHNVRSLRAIGNMNLVITARMGNIKDGGSGKIYFGPDLPGQKLGPQSAYWLDEVFYLGIGEDPDAESEEEMFYRYLQTQPADQFVAKDRSGALERLEYPDLTQVFAKIRGELEVA